MTCLEHYTAGASTSLFAFVAQIVMEVRKTPKKDSGAVREALETVRRSVMNECGLFASILVSIRLSSIGNPGTYMHARVAAFLDTVLPKT